MREKRMRKKRKKLFEYVNPVLIKKNINIGSFVQHDFVTAFGSLNKK